MKVHDPNQSAPRRLEFYTYFGILIKRSEINRLLCLKTKGQSNCPLCTIGHDENNRKICKLADMDAYYLSPWEQGMHYII